MEVRALLDTPPAPGQLTWIGLRKARRGPVEAPAAAEARVGRGLLGDRRAARAVAEPRSRRQVTLVQAEHLAVIAALLGRDELDPRLLRRNLVIRGLNLRACRDRRFAVGDAVLEATGECHPCSRMEEALGPGGYHAVRGHGGITARVVGDGRIAVGDAVRLLPDDTDPSPARRAGATAPTA